MFKNNSDGIDQQPETPKGFESYSELELLQAQEQIKLLLPPRLLRDIDLEEEMALQFQIARALQSEMMNSKEEPQKVATVMNACAAALQNLVKMQSEHYNAERLKEIEMRLIKALEKVPSEYLVSFFAWYESDEN